MKNKLKTLSAILCGFWIFNASALVHENVTVTFVGSQTAGVNSTILFVALGLNNPNNCAWNGVLFTDEALRKDALIVALAAKAYVRPVRLDYTRDAGGNCIGAGIYSQ